MGNGAMPSKWIMKERMWTLEKAAWMRWHSRLSLTRHVGVSQAERRRQCTPDREVCEQPAQGHRGTAQGQSPELQTPPSVTAAWEAGGGGSKRWGQSSSQGALQSTKQTWTSSKEELAEEGGQLPSWYCGEWSGR